MSLFDRDLQSIQEARILVGSVCDARDTLQSYSQEILDEIVQNILYYFEKHGETYVQQSILETGYGNIDDETILFKNILKYFENDYLSQRYVGILEKNDTKCALKVGVPLGTICALLPAENIIAYTIYTILLCVKTGNSLIIVPNLNALQVTTTFIKHIAEYAYEQGLPQNSIVCLEHVSEEGLQEICDHAEIDLIVDVGGQSSYDFQGNKPVIFGGMGGSAVFIEKTANVQNACHSIIESRAFDYGLLPGSEQYVIVENLIASEARQAFQQCGAHFMTAYEEKQLVSYLKQNQKIIGKSAYSIAQNAGFLVSEQTQVLISEQPYIFDENPFFNEMRFPILTFCCESDWLHACEKCMQLLKEKRTGHTLAIHSSNNSIIENFILKKPVGRIIVNAPASFTSMGYQSSLPPSMILGGLTMKKGIVAHNVTPDDFTYYRYVAYGEYFSDNQQDLSNNLCTNKTHTTIKQSKNTASDIQHVLYQILENLLK